MLTLYTADPKVFPDEEITFVEAVSDLSAQALANARFCEWARRKEIEIRPDLVEWYSSWAQK